MTDYEIRVEAIEIQPEVDALLKARLEHLPFCERMRVVEFLFETGAESARAMIAKYGNQPPPQ